VNLDDLNTRMTVLEEQMIQLAADHRRLGCESCGATSDPRSHGWRSLLGRDDDDRSVAVVMCPTRAADVDMNT
jgi:hypothetical protein